MSAPVRLDDPAGQDALEAAYRRLRERGPVVCVELPDGLRTWVITRYAEGRRALRDPRFIKDLRELTGPGHGLGGNRYAEDVYVVEGRHMLNSDGDEHVRLRGVVAAQLSAQAVAAREPEIRRITEDLVDRFAGSAEPVDLMSAYARPVPEIVMGRILGLPDEVMLEAAVLSRQLGQRDDPLSPPMRRAYNDLVDLMRVHTRTAPDDERTVLAALHAALAQGRITRRELVSTVLMLIGAGISSTAIAIAHGAATTAQAANTLWSLLGDDEQAGALVDELLRHHPPFAFSPWRFAREAVEVGGVVIPAGAVVFVLLAAVNRDPGVIEDPDQVRPGRASRSGSLTFGHGPHYCIGAHLARTEITTALATLHRRCPRLRLAVPYGETEWQGLLFDRTPVALPVYPGVA